MTIFMKVLREKETILKEAIKIINDPVILAGMPSKDNNIDGVLEYIQLLIKHEETSRGKHRMKY
jgi:hypothetical protein